MTKNKFIIIRVDSKLKDDMVKIAGGDRKLSVYLRALLEKHVQSILNKRV